MKSKFSTILLFVLIFGSFHISGQTTSIMSFNIRYDNPKDNENSWENRKVDVVGLIEYYHPDFLGIQEGLNNQVNYIDKNTSNYNYIGVGREDGDKKGEFCAIYYDSTKFELIVQKTFWLSNTPNTISTGWDAALERICTYGKFKNKITQDSIHIFNAHLDHMGTQARLMSAKLILNKIKEFGLENAKVVVMGDLNCNPMSEPITLLKQEMDESSENSETKPYGPKGTFNGFKNNIEVVDEIDYIFTKNVQIYSFRHIDDKLPNNLCVSDHLPVFVEIKIE